MKHRNTVIHKRDYDNFMKTQTTQANIDAIVQHDHRIQFTI